MRAIFVWLCVLFFSFPAFAGVEVEEEIVQCSGHLSDAQVQEILSGYIFRNGVELAIPTDRHSIGGKRFSDRFVGVIRDRLARTLARQAEGAGLSGTQLLRLRQTAFRIPFEEAY